MTKHCAVCNAENREEAQFCRSCGTAFVAATGHGSFGDEPSAENVCSECGFRNKPGLRYCANCGMNLAAGTTDLAPLGDLAATSDDTSARASPPPVSYASFETVEPYPAEPAMPSGYPPSLEDTAPLDIPDPDARIAIRQQEAQDVPAEFLRAAAPESPNQAKRVIAIGIAALVVAAIAAWTFLGRESSLRPAATVAPAAVTPLAVSPPPQVASAAAPIIIEVPATTASAAGAGVVENAPAVPPAASVPVPDATPPGAAPQPTATHPAPAEAAADAEAKRLAAEKARRDKAARDKVNRDKAERDAKAKALADQREQAAAAARAEQEAQARKRAEQEAQRARATAAPVASAPAAPQTRGVRETCAGRGTIAEAICQSRLCSAAEHANEPICRQIREAEEKRRNALN